MAKFNSEFNYRHQVIGETVWEKIKTLHGFMDGRKHALALEQVTKLKEQAIYAKLKYLQETNAPQHEIIELQADIFEMEALSDESKKNFQDVRDEIAILKKLFDELYAIAEPTRLKHADGTPYSDEEMFEANAANEFTVWLVREMQAEIMANGHPSAARLKNAMSNPVTWNALKQIGIIDQNTKFLVGNVDPTKVELIPADNVVLEPPREQEKLENNAIQLGAKKVILE